MPGFTNPRYTQTPNEIFDTMMADMDPAELKVALAIIRLTMGYHRPRCFASIRRLQNMTGLSYNGVLAGAKKAEKRGIIKKICGGGADTTIWDLVIDWDKDTPSASEAPSASEGVPPQPVRPPPSASEAPSVSEGQLNKVNRNKGQKEKQKETTTTKKGQTAPRIDPPPNDPAVVVVGESVSESLLDGESKRQPVSGDDGHTWPLAAILHSGGERIHSVTAGNEKTFIQQWLYAITSNQNGNGIRMPVKYALSRQDISPGPEYARIVQAGPAALAAWQRYGTPLNGLEKILYISGAHEIIAGMCPDLVPQPIEPDPDTEALKDDPGPSPWAPPPEMMSRILEPVNGDLTPLRAWRYARDEMKREMTARDYATRLEDTTIRDYSLETGQAIIRTPDPETAEWLNDRLAKTLSKWMTGALNRETTIKFVTDR